MKVETKKCLCHSCAWIFPCLIVNIHCMSENKVHLKLWIWTLGSVLNVSYVYRKTDVMWRMIFDFPICNCVIHIIIRFNELFSYVILYIFIWFISFETTIYKHIVLYPFYYLKCNEILLHRKLAKLLRITNRFLFANILFKKNEHTKTIFQH